MSATLPKDRTNAERQKRYRTRLRNARNGYVTDDNGQPNSTLTRIAHNLAAGMSHNQALIQAGSSPSARLLIDKAKQGLTDLCKVNGLTVTKVVTSVVQDMDAIEKVYTPDGCIERPSSALRPAARRDAIALLDRAGELPSASNTHQGASITINIVRFSGGTQDVVDAAHVIEAQATEQSQAIESNGD